jgi:microcystin degradation protein MlrC
VLGGLVAARPVDLVLLFLHGSMMAEGCDDVEGELLERIRHLAGSSTTVVVLIDPHAHLTDRMVRAATLIAAFHEWPHVDVDARARHVIDIGARIASGEVQPAAGVWDCAMIGAFPTEREPMRGFVDQLRALEASGRALSASLVHGFPWSDSADVGAKMMVWCDRDAECASRIARECGERLYALRDHVSLSMDLGLEDALDYVEHATTRPIVLCDAGDNVPAGAAGDSTYVLRRVLERGLGDICFGPLWDPVAVAKCWRAGVGSTLRLSVGGHSGPLSGGPLAVTARVTRLMRDEGPQQAGHFGDCVWIELERGMDLLLHSRRASLTHIDQVRRLGIDLARRKAFFGKMLMHGAAALRPLAAEVFSVATPGTLDMRFAQLPVRRAGQWWPRSERSAC